MSLGSRTVDRGGRAIFRAACPALTPREPLLFLYPRFQTTVSFPLPIKEQHSSSNTETSTIPLDTKSRSNLNSLKHVETSQDSSPRIQLPNRNHTRRPERSINSSIINSELNNAVNETSAQVRQVLGKLSSKAEKRKTTEEYEDTTRRSYQARRRKTMEIVNGDEVDWREILSELVENTPQSREVQENGVKVVVPRSAVGTLLYHPQNSIWEIRRRISCSIHFLQKEKATKETRTLLLTGTRENVSRATQEIRNVIHKNTESTSIVTEATDSLTDRLELSTLETPMFRKSPIMASQPRITKSFLAREPDRWTEKTFAEHVLRLTKSKERTQRRGVDASTTTSETHDNHVRNHLNMLFENPNFYNVISVKAFNIALSYFVKTGQIKDGRRLFVGMEMIGMQMKIETFNIMLRGAAKVHDLHNFAFLLRMMLKRGLSPDPWTWLAFLRALTDFQVQVHVIAAMRKKGLLQLLEPVQLLCRELSSLEAEWSLMKRQHHIEFVMHMDQRYGPHWLTTETANRILHQLALHGLFSRCCQFAVFVDSRLVKTNSISLQTVISHCRILGNFEGAIQTLKVFQGLGVEPEAGTYHDLFYMAMDKHLYSFARVVWHYACLSNATTFRMRKLVANTGSRRSPRGSDRSPTFKGVYSPREFWLQTVGKVILNNATILFQQLDLDNAKNLNNKSEMTKNPGLSCISASRHQTPRRTSRGELKKSSWTHTQMNHDLNIYQQWLPAENLSDALERAYHQDMKWNGQKIWFEKSLEWMCNNAVSVKLLRKPSKYSGSGGHVKS